MGQLLELPENHDLGDMELKDEMVWKLDEEKGFFMKSMYGALCSTKGYVALGRCVWNNLIPLKVSFLLWEVWRDRALTIDNMIARGLVIPNWCCKCKEAAESSSHLFIHCPVVAKLWILFLVHFGVSWVQPSCARGLLTSWSAQSIRGGSALARSM